MMHEELRGPLAYGNGHENMIPLLALEFDGLLLVEITDWKG